MEDIQKLSQVLSELRVEAGQPPPSSEERPAILVTGGAGFIGSHTAKALFEAGFNPVVFDNLSTGHIEAVRWGRLFEEDLSDASAIRMALKQCSIRAVVHCAGSALVSESMVNPALYFRNNTANTANLLEAMAAENVRAIVFSSSCAVYGNPETTPINEDHPKQPVNPYGESKLAAEKQIGWYGHVHAVRSVILRYFNAAGSDPGGQIGENHDPETHIIPLAIEACLGQDRELTIYGVDYPTPDGTAIRDYIHVCDLASAHVRAVQYLLSGGEDVALNLGTGRGYSIREVMKQLGAVARCRVPHVEGPRRPGDPAILVADASKAERVLGWRPLHSDLETMLRDAYSWKKKQGKKTITTQAVERKQSRVAVIGAGPAGLTAAYELAKGGAQVDVYEAAPDVGGMSKTIKLWGQLVDIGPHRFFSTDQRVNRLWLEVAGTDYEMVDRKTRILYKKSFFNYPITAMDALMKLGIFEAAHCVLSYARQLVQPEPDRKTFEDWVVRAFGRRLFEIFFKSYSEKLWGIPCGELDADFAAQRIKKFSLLEAIKAATGLTGGTRHKTLADRFAYPKQGTGLIYQRMADFLKSKGQNLFLKTPVERVEIRDGAVKGVWLSGEKFVAYDNVISTMPLTTVVKSLPEAPAEVKFHVEKLNFRNTILVYLHIDAENLFPDNWLYIHSPELQTGRITNFRNWSKDIQCGKKTTILAMEYWCNYDEPMWACSEAELVEMAKKEIVQTGLTKGAKILDAFVYKVNRCYPVYSAGYKNHLKPIESYLSTISGFHAIGRYGAFKYNNQDHSILMGLMAAKQILDSSDKSDLWNVNTDYESYQESSTITESGLVMAGQ